MKPVGWSLFALVVVFGSNVLANVAVHSEEAQQTTTPARSWSREIWPFPIDQWGTGLAFTCPAGECGSEVHLYLRVKAGFCRCATGVSDDDEIDRIGDIEVFGTNYKPLAPGHPVTAGLWAGRARLFAVERPLRSPISVVAVALADKCDAISATVIAKDDADRIVAEAEALNFLSTTGIRHWIEAQASTE